MKLISEKSRPTKSEAQKEVDWFKEHFPDAPIGISPGDRVHYMGEERTISAVKWKQGRWVLQFEDLDGSFSAKRVLEKVFKK